MKTSIFVALLPFAFAAPLVEREAAPVVELAATPVLERKVARDLAKRAAPTVIAPSPAATVVGKSILNVETFNGIPFAKPPVGELRLKPPQPLTAGVGVIDGGPIAKACPQMLFSVSKTTETIPLDVLGTVLNLPIFQTILNAGEDCLTVNIQRPAGTKKGDKLPVLFWIFGGGFELGSTSTYDGTSIVLDSVSQGKPVIFIAVNYRVGGFGFLPGKEILADGSSNLGLMDQRLGLQWVADNIEAFGGDKDKVTIWGESAGSISVLDQMVLYDGDHTYKGKPLFRAGIMNSGSVIPASPVDGTKGQAIYGQVVAAGGCSGSKDTLACLRALDYSTFLNATNSVPGLLSYTSVSLSYLPRPDGKALTASPDVLVASGKIAKVPFIVGDQEDEGTLFGLFTSNITTIPQVSSYLKDIYFPFTSSSIIDGLVATYQTIIEDGSPFRSLLLNNWYPQFKRISAIVGDLTFTLTRRLFLETAAAVNPNVPSWSYLSTYRYGFPVLGTFHASDLIEVFYGAGAAAKDVRGYYLSFIYELDPNKNNNLPNWPQWKTAKQLMQFGLTGAADLLPDNFRQDSYEFMKSNSEALYI